MPPKRLCVACRQSTSPDEMIRLVMSPAGEIVVDLRGKLPGRGAWVHCTSECIDALERHPKKLKRSFPTASGPLNLRTQLQSLIRRAFEDGLSQAAAAGALVGGFAQLTDALDHGRVHWVIVASDASTRTIDDLKDRASRVETGDQPRVRFVEVPHTRDELGLRIGRGPRAALGILSSRAATHLRRQLRRLADLG